MLLSLEYLILTLIFMQCGNRPDNEAVPVYEIVYSTDSLESWNACNTIGPLAAPWSDHDDRTTFRAFYTDEYFIFRFDVEDTCIVETGNTEESVAAGDRVELFFSGSPGLNKSYYCIEISPAGRILDYEAKYYRQFDNAWSLHGLIVDAKSSPSGYRVEGKIPLSFFRDMTGHQTLRNTQIRVGAFRAEMNTEALPDDFVWFSWVRPKSARPDFHIPSSFGLFQFK